MPVMTIDGRPVKSRTEQIKWMMVILGVDEITAQEILEIEEDGPGDVLDGTDRGVPALPIEAP